MIGPYTDLCVGIDNPVKQAIAAGMTPLDNVGDDFWLLSPNSDFFRVCSAPVVPSRRL